MRRAAVRIWKYPVLRRLLCCMEGMAWILSGCAGLAGLRLCGDVPVTAQRVVLTVLTGASAYAAGRRCGFHGRRHGMAEGMLCAGLIWLVLLCGCLVMHGSGRALPERLLLMLVCGAAGGIRGVNRRLWRSPD